MTYQDRVQEFNYCPPGKEIDLVLWGILGEFGEVSEKIKKHIRGGGEIEDLAGDENLQKELGDVWWYFNVHCSRYHFNIEHNHVDSYVTLSLHSLMVDALKALASMWGACKRWNDPGNIVNLIEFSFAYQGVCAKLGFDMERIEKENLRKLLDRKRRGVIHGEGDDR